MSSGGEGQDRESWEQHPGRRSKRPRSGGGGDSSTPPTVPPSSSAQPDPRRRPYLRRVVGQWDEWSVSGAAPAGAGRCDHPGYEAPLAGEEGRSGGDGHGRRDDDDDRTGAAAEENGGGAMDAKGDDDEDDDDEENLPVIYLDSFDDGSDDDDHGGGDGDVGGGGDSHDENEDEIGADFGGDGGGFDDGAPGTGGNAQLEDAPPPPPAPLTQRSSDESRNDGSNNERYDGSESDGSEDSDSDSDSDSNGDGDGDSDSVAEEQRRRQQETDEDLALVMAVDEKESLFRRLEFNEGGTRFEPRVINHCRMNGGGLKFLVEYRDRNVTAPSGSSSSASSSTSSSRPRPAPSSCPTWKKIGELIVPSAALDYLKSLEEKEVDNFPGLGAEVAEMRREVLRRKLRLLGDDLITGVVDNDGNEEEVRGGDAAAEVAFCCYLDRCDHGDEAGCGAPRLRICDETRKFHRACCHNIKSNQFERWHSSAGAAIAKLNKLFDEHPEGDGDGIVGVDKKEKALQKLCPQHLLNSRTKSTAAEETRTQNDAYMPPADSLQWSNSPNCDAMEKFRKIRNKRQLDPTKKRRAVVLEPFGGGVGALHVLKRLGIAIRRHIYVDHDPVARHVTRWNHDASYREGRVADDGIEHVYSKFESFEEVEQNIEQLVRDYGPIDIVPGGPPCQPYSSINAKRKGEQDDHAYMRRFKRLIDHIVHFNKLYHDGFEELFFLVENVPGAETEDFGLSHFRCNAKTWGPCHRDRIFYFNWEPYHIPEEDCMAMGTNCLVDGWMTPVKFKTSMADEKVRTLLASQGRIYDEATMIKVKVRDEFRDALRPGADRPASHGIFKHLDTNDRERLMGLPVGYVQAPIDDLFKNLHNAYASGGICADQWRDTLHPRYWNFLKGGHTGYKFALNGSDAPCALSLQIQDPNTPDKCYHDYEYAWHLIGNGFSIPQLEFLMTPLQELFHRRVYEGFTDHKYSWEEE